MRKSIAITGPTGFVGQHILFALKHYDVDVVLLCRDLSKLNAEYRNQYNCIEIDLNTDGSKTYINADKPDTLLHLAWGGLPNYKSLHHFEYELPMHYRFISSMVKAGLKQVVTTGTCFEYGMQEGCLKEDLVTQPTNPYGFAKDTLYKQLNFLQAQKNFALTWVRLFYLWGEGQAENSLYSQLCTSINECSNIFDMSSGQQIRDFLPIEIAADYLIRLALLDDGIGVVNLSSGKPITIEALVRQWVLDRGASIHLNLGKHPYPDYEPKEFWGDATKLQKALKMGQTVAKRRTNL